jgi:iron complex transport system ATP-binding protein
MSSPVLLDIQSLTLLVPGRTLIADLNWTVRAGERWCVIGRNGAGKSTLLRVLSGVQEPINTHGVIQWQGKDLGFCTPEELARLRAYAEQFPVGGMGLRAIDAVMAAQWPWRDQFSTGADEVEAMQSLERCDVAHLAYAQWETLSGGERQRVSLAACFAQKTPVLVLDEPTSHLDVSHQVALLDTLNQSSQSCGQAVIASLHEVSLIGRGFTHALLFMGDEGSYVLGEIKEVVHPDNLSKALGHPITEAITADGKKIYVPA